MPRMGTKSKTKTPAPPRHCGLYGVEGSPVSADLLPPPNTPFGHSLRGLWSLDPGIHFLNHGSFGAAPRHVFAAQAR